jgi:hypothetical protein
MCISAAVRDGLLKETQPSRESQSWFMKPYPGLQATHRIGHGFREELEVPQEAPIVGMVGRAAIEKA